MAAKPICVIARCRKAIHNKTLGLCRSHYRRLRLYGSPWMGPRGEARRLLSPYEIYARAHPPTTDPVELAKEAERNQAYIKKIREGIPDI